MRRDRGGVRVLLGLFLLTIVSPLRAERLPVRTYSTADGLQGGGIGRIFRDSKGFLWFCSGEGASRFDGYTFAPFGRLEGFGSPIVHDVLETRDGTFWFATVAGLVRLAGDSRPTVFPLPAAGQYPIRLLEDRAGTLWCGSSNGLVRVERSGRSVSFRPVELGLPHELWDDPFARALAEDGVGGLWIGAGSGLYHLRRDGSVERTTKSGGLPNTQVRDLVATPDGTLWLAGLGGIARIRPAASSSRTTVERLFTDADGLPDVDIQTLFVSRDGRFWAGSVRGLSVLEGDRFRSFGAEQGISAVFSIEESAGGDFWMGSDWGVQRLKRQGLLTYGTADGIADPAVTALLEDRAGDLCALRGGMGVLLAVRSAERFETLRVRLPKGVTTPGWAYGQPILQDHLGEWWYPTLQGLCRFAKADSARELAAARAVRVYTQADGLATNDAFVVFEDSRGDVWISTASAVTNGLARWNRSTDRIEPFRDGPGLPPLRTSLPSAFAEDLGGNVWVAFNGAGLARYREGRFELFGAADGVPEGWLLDLHVDSAGRLWIAGTVGGLAVIDDPRAERPKLRPFGVEQGLSSSSVRCVTEDAWGRIYVGTGVGVDRIDRDGGGVHHFTAAEGLAPGSMRVALRDRHGALWFGTSRGLSRYEPSAPEPRRSPAIFVTRLRVSGALRAVPGSGAVSVDLPDVPPDGNRVQVDFVSPARLEEDSIRYQYRLEGAEDRWSRPAAERTVDFASLSPGKYRFQVRAVAADGAVSPSPAEVRFTVLAPVWRRPWFLALASALVAAAAWGTFQYRLRHLLALERVRTRIAADLHDDIGSSLSRIAILSEVVKRQTPEGRPETARFLTEIAETSRQLVDSMSDIVWSIDPRRDDLKNLLARIGQFASGAVDAQGIHWTFDTPADAERVKMTPEQRRGTFLILKEAITNALKHAGCTHLSLRVAVEGRGVVAEVRDDGRGMPEPVRTTGSSSTARGRGLLNMKSRAKELGGRLEISSTPGEGTLVRLELPHRA